MFSVYNSELKRLKAGFFLNQTIDEWNKKRRNELREKFFLYSGHDTTVTNILSAFNVWEQQFPDYGVTAMLEMSQHKETREFGVEVKSFEHTILLVVSSKAFFQIFLRNSTKSEPTQLTIPGCAKFCPLSEVERLLSDNISQHLPSDCKAKNENFTEPPPSGP